MARTLGIESVELLAVLDTLATLLDDARVFDGLTTARDALRVAGALAWVVVLDGRGRTRQDVADAVGVRGVRAKAGLDAVNWDDRAAVSRSFLAAADAL